jgi:hypothetical protein
MTASGSKSLPTLGFLTVVEHAELGWTGGYLVLNLLGRPLEFHCTAPVRPNRAQEILYGPTLKAFLFGEQIGQTLLEKSHFQPLFVCTDLAPVLAVRDTVSLPVALLTTLDGETEQGGGIDRVARSSSSNPLTCHGQRQLAVSPRHPEDEQQIRDLWQADWSEFDLSEPFERIRDAIGEAQKAA